jgi:SAM-dependent methyltransferase
MASPIAVCPQLYWPQFPDFPAEFYAPARLQDPLRARNASFDWSVFTPEGLRHAEAYWDKATAVLASLLPARYAVAQGNILGLNVGTFTGAYQKAWMRRGYSMAGVEKEDVIRDLLAYGCEGSRDDAFELRSVSDARFDFAVLDRVYCRQPFYERYEVRTRHAPRAYFKNIRRVLKPGGAFIGVLYDWYSNAVVSQLAALGGLTLWPMKSFCLAFQVDLAREPSDMPDPALAAPDDPCWINVQINNVQHKLFLPTNEVATGKGATRSFDFAPPLRAGAKRDGARSRKRAALFRELLGGSNGGTGSAD